mgnify:CR=1 FL=1
MTANRHAEPEGDPFGFTSISYNISFNPAALKVVESYSLLQLLEMYGGILWEEGRHKENVKYFVHEMDEILAGQAFSGFTDDAVEHLIGVLRGRGNSNATINRKMAALSKLLRKAYRMGTIHSLPEFRRQKERVGRIRFLTRREEASLFARIGEHSPDYEALSVFLVDTGARLGEAIGLRWSDVADGRATFWITKSNRSRTIPLTRRAMDALDRQRQYSTGPFRHIQQHKYRAAWNDAKAAAGLGSDPNVVPHILRHTCASRLVRGGIDIRRVQMWLGHQTLQMTMRYAHLATNDLDMCVPILELA